MHFLRVYKLQHCLFQTYAFLTQCQMLTLREISAKNDPFCFSFLFALRMKILQSLIVANFNSFQMLEVLLKVYSESQIYEYIARAHEMSS